MSLDDYLNLPYHIVMVRDDTGGDPGWVIWVDELPGCISQGDSPEEATEMIRDAMEGWLSVALEYGDDIPLPREETEHSGKFMVRLPRSLHRELADGARHEGVSLNQYVSTLLAGAVGWKQPKAAEKKRTRREKAAV
ncbi:MAG: type II toxin-antitoxin system HicB family antitoxin [Dehalococcoidia bacterium]|nr:type II toxin-antitoxin system HicB family antitoxin [Dehalococcoidia bacterium]